MLLRWAEVNWGGCHRHTLASERTEETKVVLPHRCWYRWDHHLKWCANDGWIPAEHWRTDRHKQRQPVWVGSVNHIDGGRAVLVVAGENCVLRFGGLTIPPVVVYPRERKERCLDVIREWMFSNRRRWIDLYWWSALFRRQHFCLVTSAADLLLLLLLLLLAAWLSIISCLIEWRSVTFLCSSVSVDISIPPISADSIIIQRFSYHCRPQRKPIYYNMEIRRNSRDNSKSGDVLDSMAL